MTAFRQFILGTLFGMMACCTQAFALEVNSHTSPNGADFSMVAMPESQQTIIRFVWRGGAAFLQEGKGGVETLGPLMVLRGGTEGIAPGELGVLFDAVNAGMRLFSSPDALHGLLIAPAAKVADVAQLMNTVLTKPTFDPRWLKRFRRDAAEKSKTAISYLKRAGLAHPAVGYDGRPPLGAHIGRGTRFRFFHSNGGRYKGLARRHAHHRRYRHFRRRQRHAGGCGAGR